MIGALPHMAADTGLFVARRMIELTRVMLIGIFVAAFGFIPVHGRPGGGVVNIDELIGPVALRTGGYRGIDRRPRRSSRMARQAELVRILTKQVHARARGESEGRIPRAVGVQETARCAQGKLSVAVFSRQVMAAAAGDNARLVGIEIGRSPCHRHRSCWPPAPWSI